MEPMPHLERRWSALQDLSGYTAGTIADGRAGIMTVWTLRSISGAILH